MNLLHKMCPTGSNAFLFHSLLLSLNKLRDQAFNKFTAFSKKLPDISYPPDTYKCLRVHNPCRTKAPLYCSDFEYSIATVFREKNGKLTAKCFCEVELFCFKNSGSLKHRSPYVSLNANYGKFRHVIKSIKCSYLLLVILSVVLLFLFFVLPF